MPIRREDIEALPGFLRWSSFGESDEGAGSRAAITYDNGDLGCVFARELDGRERELVLDYLRDVGPKDNSYLWDGSQKGWKLVSSDDDVRVSVRFERPLGELAPDRLEALRQLLGESTFNHLNASQTETELWFRGRPIEGDEARKALVDAGFEADLLEPSHQIVRELGGQSSVLLVEDDDERERLVKRMLEAGVPVEQRPARRE